MSNSAYKVQRQSNYNPTWRSSDTKELDAWPGLLPNGKVYGWTVVSSVEAWREYVWKLPQHQTSEHPTSSPEIHTIPHDSLAQKHQSTTRSVRDEFTHCNWTLKTAQILAALLTQDWTFPCVLKLFKKHQKDESQSFLIRLPKNQFFTSQSDVYIIYTSVNCNPSLPASDAEQQEGLKTPLNTNSNWAFLVYTHWTHVLIKRFCWNEFESQIIFPLARTTFLLQRKGKGMLIPRRELLSCVCVIKCIKV